MRVSPLTASNGFGRAPALGGRLGYDQFLMIRPRTRSLGGRVKGVNLQTKLGSEARLGLGFRL